MRCSSVDTTSDCRFILQSKEVIHNQLLEKQKGADEKIKEHEIGNDMSEDQC
ncbi:Prefoldin subunit 1 [Acipenser ruthenus]|uniref:Prefoldin subunit 1 n=1 Tax=Acipenser ruthenus TaxID=7906 RepID=A0A444V3A9_ACIRT|nr:Prefoldin subunit 1 [Acipenser ruthenus]